MPTQTDNDNQLGMEQPTLDMEKLSTLADQVVWRCPGLDDLTCRKALQASAREWCEVTELFTVHLEAEVSMDGKATFTTPYRATIRRVVGVHVRGRTIPVPLVHNDGRIVTVTVPPPLPHEHLFVVADLVLVPLMDAEDYPRYFLERYSAGIIAGALRMLSNMDGRPWFSKGVAAQSDRDWHQSIAECRVVPPNVKYGRMWP